MATDTPMGRCHRCGGLVSIHALDSKPRRLSGPDHSLKDIEDAMWNNEDFDIMECEACYGPGFVQVME